MGKLKPIGLLKEDIKKGDLVKILYMGDPDDGSDHVKVGRNKWVNPEGVCVGYYGGIEYNSMKFYDSISKNCNCYVSNCSGFSLRPQEGKYRLSSSARFTASLYGYLYEIIEKGGERKD